MTEEQKVRYACPKCQSGASLWREVTIAGWVDVDEFLVPQGTPEHDFCYDVEDEFGCGDCDWRGFEKSLIKMGADDKPLPIVLPGQLTVYDVICDAPAA